MAPIPESFNLEQIPDSKLWKIANRAIQMLDHGEDVIRLELGRPDFDTPEHIKKAAAKALADGKVHYVSHLGIRSLREAIADRWKHETGQTIDPDKNILITQGGTEGLFLAYAAFLNPGDEILIGDPGWITYFHAPRLFGISIRRFPLLKNGKFGVDIQELRKAVTPKTRMILINSPSNPTGGVLPPEEIKQIADLAMANNIMLLSDEVYHRLIFNNPSHLSPGALPGMEELGITVDSFSKTYSMTGWRLGWVISSEKNIKKMLKVHQQSGATCCSFGQYGAEAALRGSQDCVESMRTAYAHRAALISDRLNKIPALTYIRPEGGLYVFIKVKQTGLDGAEFAERFLEEQKVAIMPGDAFGELGKDYIRMNISADDKVLHSAMDRLEKFLQSLDKPGGLKAATGHIPYAANA